MSVGYTKPKAPPLVSNVVAIGEDEDNGASEQLLVLCEHMMREHLHQEPSEISRAVATYAGKERDLYDMIIWTISSNPKIMSSKRKYTKMDNIFEAYSGFTYPRGASIRAP